MKKYLKNYKSLVEILAPPTTTAKDKPDAAFNCFDIYLTWAAENGVYVKDIIILQNLREIFLKKSQLRIISR